ncbi:Phage minor tail protein [compost metagenome]
MDEFPDIGTPDWGFAEQPDADVDQIKLGDGYEFREPRGLNYLKDTWSPKWSNLDETDAETAYAFLRARLKLTPFLWTHPLSAVQYKVLCQSVSLEYDTFDNAVLTASLSRDFNP